MLKDIPIDSEEFAELELGIEIVPVHDLRPRVDADAFITRDFGSILIDNDCLAFCEDVVIVTVFFVGV